MIIIVCNGSLEILGKVEITYIRVIKLVIFVFDLLSCWVIMSWPTWTFIVIVVSGTHIN